MANNPTLLTMPLCRDADKSTIPATDAGTAGIFSEQYGWQSINSLPLQAGGKAVKREDFNGAFALLGGIAFYAQKGFTFNFDSSQEYFAGCVVIDPLDGKKYNAKNDVAKGGSNPSLDPTNWEVFGSIDISGKANITLDNLSAFHRDIITTSGTYTAPATALYKITAKGGGGGGSSGGGGNTLVACGNGGGEGGYAIAYVSMSAGDTATLVIGAGGTGGAKSTTQNLNAGSDGGNTTVTIDGNTYTGGGGGGGTAARGGQGGTGTIEGANGQTGAMISYSGNHSHAGGAGGGNGGGSSSPATNGGGGNGGLSATGSSTPAAGGDGGDGYVWFEYFATI